MDTKIKREEFLKQINEKYGEKYECKIPEWKKEINPSDMVNVTCQRHGSFIASAYDLINGIGCFGCFKEDKWKE